MRLLECNNAGQFILTKDSVGDDKVPPYAILSHTWGAEEVTFKDLLDGAGRAKAGYEKIRFCGEQARRDGLKYFWVDTCCIDKCYVYLSDVSTPVRGVNNTSGPLALDCESAFRKIEFFSRQGERLGDKSSLKQQIHDITGIPLQALEGTPLSRFGIDERLCWAENRQTTRKEDMAYSLLGIFDIHMPLIYGEGRDNALARLREEIDKPPKAFNHLPCASDAPFNSYSNQNFPYCLPDTRIDLLQEICTWAEGLDTRRILWLNGLAGTGKSTIARTVARRCFDKRRVGASFFFSRGGGDVGRAGKFVTSIAVQLAENIRFLRPHISRAMMDHGSVSNWSLGDQWHLLVLGPLSKLEDNVCGASFVLIIDALDECNGDSDIRLILQLLSEAQSLTRVQLRILVTSRPEAPIRSSFLRLAEDQRYDVVLHTISASIIDQDIWTFLEHSLRLIGEENAQDPGWPGAELITALKNISAAYLDVLRNSIQPGFSQQDRERYCSMLRDIVGSIAALFSPLSVDSLSRLLATPKQRVDRILKDLHAILDMPKDHATPLRLHHPSFRDFLIDSERCNDLDFWVDEKRVHLMLANNCIRLMSTSLRQDICRGDSHGQLAAEASNSMQAYLVQDLQYACLYWVEHLQKSGERLHDNDQVHRFLRAHVLHWIETLAWMGRASICPNLGHFIYDARRFLTYSRPGIEQSPLQTYCSALVFALTGSTVRRRFEACVPSWISRLPELDVYWSALLQTLEGHSDAINAVAFSADGKRLASASDDFTVRLWDAPTGAAQATLLGHRDQVNAVAFSPNEGPLASGSGKKRGMKPVDCTVRLWDAATGAALRTFTGHSSFVQAVAFSPNGKYLASSSYDRAIKVWDPDTGAALQALQIHTYHIPSIAFSPDSKLLVSASGDSTVQLWDVTSGVALDTLKSHRSTVSDVGFSPDGKLLVSASFDSTVKLWDATTGAVLFYGHKGYVCATDFSPDGTTLASASDDWTIRFWDPATGAALQTLRGHSSALNDVIFSPDGKRLASAAYDRTVRMWDTASATAETPRSGIGHNDHVDAVVFSPDGKTVGRYSIRGPYNHTMGCSHRNTAADTKGPFKLYNTVSLWDTATGNMLKTFHIHQHPDRSVFLSPNCQQIASSSHDYTIKIWDAATGAVLQNLNNPTGYISAAAFSPDGKQLASELHNGLVILTDVTTGALLRRLAGHSYSIHSLAFSPDGKLLASASEDMTIRLWDVATGMSLQVLQTDVIVKAISFSSDASFLKTDRGLLGISFVSLGMNPLPPRAATVRGLFVAEQWIVCGTERLLWLPSDYRQRSSAVNGNTVVLGHVSGRVSFLEFGPRTC
ncbi:hypothetical protein NLG97_g5280 [Lecanicillium saksenae]|uniref:Uncharacterized protein n=1 Tax=Lecanicillium saksenae TaxID=468837 RepID=A0ACC1QVG5_9HYPO|nr:hypothetical protein NLG97_g5280 [Lecanicillium saksenae]